MRINRVCVDITTGCRTVGVGAVVVLVLIMVW